MTCEKDLTEPLRDPIKIPDLIIVLPGLVKVAFDIEKREFFYRTPDPSLSEKLASL